MDPMKLDSSDWSGVEVSGSSQCPGVGRGEEEYNGLTDIILNFALSCAVDTTIVWVSPGVVTAVTNQLF